MALFSGVRSHLDATEDAVHGHQEGPFFHGYASRHGIKERQQAAPRQPSTEHNAPIRAGAMDLEH